MTQLPESIAKLSDAEKRSLLAKLLRQKARRSRTFPLSFAQQRLWFLDRLEPGNYAYNIPIAARAIGRLDLEALQQALEAIVRRHEVLRATFHTSDRGDPVQVIEPEVELSVSVIDVQGQSDAAIREQIRAEAQQPFDLTQAPLLRAKVLQHSPNEWTLLLTLHHIGADGWSMGVLVRELAALYDAFCQGQPSPLPELPVQYADYAVWQRQQLQGEALDSLLAYWRQQIGGNPPTLQLPVDRCEDEPRTPVGATMAMELPDGAREGMDRLCRDESVTPFMVLLAAFKTLLHCSSGQTDILVGTDVANRARAELEQLIGFFVNLVVLRTDCSGNPTFRELLGRVRQMALGAYAHQELPFEKLVEELQPQRQADRMPMVQVLFVLQNTPIPKFELSNLEFTSVEINDETSKFNLGLFLRDRNGKLSGDWRYRADLFSRETMEQLAKSYAELLQQAIAHPDWRLNQFEVSVPSKSMPSKSKPRKPSKFKSFKRIQPKAVQIAHGELVEFRNLNSDRAFPALVQPTTTEVDLVDWAKNNRDKLESKLLQHGAILFRGFDIRSVDAFENVARSICPQLYDNYGDLPRAGMSDRVYGSTPYPSDRAILFHNESSHLDCFPQKIWFCCLKAASEGGATPIVDCRQAYESLDPNLRDTFEQKGLMYVRNYIEGLDVSWQDFFHTDDKATVEKVCRDRGMEFEWKGDRLTTRQYAPAVIRHPQTGDAVFFNQIQLHHIAGLDEQTRESLQSIFKPQDLPRHVCYGDGTPIESDVVNSIIEIYQQHAVRFDWQPGDVLMLDNMLASHGRDPYRGDRKIVVAMGGMVSQSDSI